METWPQNTIGVEDQLARILDSVQFRKSPRLQTFLRFVVSLTLEGKAEEIKESTIAAEVFGREDTADDSIVRSAARRLRARLQEYYQQSDIGDPIRIELPVGSYVPVFTNQSQLTVPAPLERLAAVSDDTAYEWAKSPNGNHAAVETTAIEAPAINEVPLRRPRVGFYAVGVLAALVCVAAGVLAWRVFSVHESSTSIAVLPFTNLTADPANQYFSDGLTDEITDSLARLKTLRVIARSSAFQFKGKPVDVREVGRLLHVANVLEGSVERSGDRIRVIAHLERVSDGSQVWSNTYERRTSDLFAVQSELAAGIAGSLKAGEGVPATKHIPKPQAHELAIKARYDVQQMTTESLMRAEREYQQAIGLDPEYAAAYLGLASAKYDQFAARGSAYQTEGERKSAEQLFRKALELDPDLPAAHAMLAALAMQYDWNWSGAEREFQLAVAGHPSATAESYYAFFLLFRGRLAEADQHLRRMLDLDPFSTATMNNLAVARNLEGRFAEARENAQRMGAQYPKMLAPQLMIGMAYIAEGHPKLALPIFEQLEQRFPQAPLFEAMARARAGQREEALKLIRPFEEKYQSSGASLQWFALVYALLGDEPNTVKWLERSADLREWQVLNIAVNPAYAPMRNSPGFRALEKRMGLQ
ncbi:MAG TPA: hypothetical protein VGL97_03675 [Bryobacteraceae bacterium]